MSRLNLDPLSALVPVEPALAPPGIAGIERSGPGSFDEHLRRAQSATEAPPSRDAREPAAPGTSEHRNESPPPADRAASDSEEREAANERSDAGADGQPAVAESGEAAGEDKDRSKPDPDEADEGTAATGQATPEANAAVAAELILNGGSATEPNPSDREGEGKEQPAKRQALAPKPAANLPTPSDVPLDPAESPVPQTEIAPENPRAVDLADLVEMEQNARESTKTAGEKSSQAAGQPGEMEVGVDPTVAEASEAAVAPQPSAPSVQASGAGGSSRRSAQRPAEKASAANAQVDSTDDLPEQQVNVDATPKLEHALEKLAAELQALPSQGNVQSSDAAVKPASHLDSPAQVSASPSGPDAQEPRPTSAAPQQTAPGAEQLDRVRFVQRVARAFEAAGDQAGSVRLRLYPPELGALRIELTVRHGMMSARMEAETPEARNLLLDNLPALRDRLAEQQIKVQRFDIDLMDPRTGGSGQRFADQPQPETRSAGGGPRAAHSRESAAENPPALRSASLYGEGSGFDVTV